MIFSSICVQTETSPKSKFNKDYFLSKVTENGRINLLGNTLINVKGREKAKEKLTESEITEAVRHYFHLEI